MLARLNRALQAALYELTAPTPDERQPRFERSGNGGPPARSLSPTSEKLEQFRTAFHLQPPELLPHERPLRAPDPHYMACDIYRSDPKTGTKTLDGTPAERGTEVHAANALHDHVQARNAEMRRNVGHDRNWANTAPGKAHLARTKRLLGEFDGLRAALKQSNPSRLPQGHAEAGNDVVYLCERSATTPYCDPVGTQTLRQAGIDAR